MNLIEAVNLIKRWKGFLNKMLRALKKTFYFPVAWYFRFFAKIQLQLWKPRIIVITGSNGKTTLLHLIESQLNNRAKYSHHANSSFGIPFNILGIDRKELKIMEWPVLFLKAPFKAFKSPPKENIYIVEADCDRPNEGKFLGSLLKPEVTIWLTVSYTHSMNFKNLDAIAKEFGNFLKYTSNLAIINGDSDLIIQQISNTKATVKPIHQQNHLENYTITHNASRFRIDGNQYLFKFLLPEENFYSISASKMLMDYLNFNFNSNFKNFILPPGRSSVFKGIKNTIIIDGSYNATPASMMASLDLYKVYPGAKKWAILSDMVELGKEEEIEHQNLAKLIADAHLSRIILMGPRMIKYTLPKLKELAPKLNIVSFERPDEVLHYLQQNISGGEILFFKGARFLEGVIEHLLKDKNDIHKLCRREKVWQKRRKKWGL